MKIVKKGLIAFISLLAAGSLLTGCGTQHVHHAHHSKTTEVKKMRHYNKVHHHKRAKVNKKDVDKAGLSTNDIKKDSRAVHQKKSTQPVD